jgi:ketosteroid isomerase-like protein
MVEAHSRGDSAVFKRYLADDYVGTNMNGIKQSKTDLLNFLPNISATMKMINTAPKEGATFDMKEVELHVLGDTVVMTYRFDYQTTQTANLVSFRVTDVYTKRGDDWQLKVNHRTLIPATRRSAAEVLKMNP